MEHHFKVTVSEIWKDQEATDIKKFIRKEYWILCSTGDKFSSAQEIKFETSFLTTYLMLM